MPSLNYATGVTSAPQSLYNAIGWFNFASLPANITVGNSTPYVATLSNTIKGGGSISARFTLSRQGTAGVNTTFSPLVPPTWNGATYGITAYTGLTQKVCLQDWTDGGSPNYGVITVDNISIQNKYGEPITNYNFYFMDSESPQASPSFETFMTNGSPWSIFYTPPQNPNFAQSTVMSGIGTTIAQTTNQGNMPLLLTTNPSSIMQTVTGGGAMSFGVVLTTAELVKVVTNRIDPNDQFQLTITGPNSGTTITSGQSTGAQAQGVQVISGNGGQSVFTFNESMAPGSVSSLSNYTQTVQVSNLTLGGTTLPSTIALGAPLTLNIGDFALVTITNTPPPSANLTSSKTVSKTAAVIGNILTYTIPFTNTGNTTATNIILIDTIPNGTSLVAGSLKQDGVSVSGTPSPPGVTLPNSLGINKSSTVTFQVLITTLPNPNPIPNSALLNYTYFTGTISLTKSSSTNTVNTQVNLASLGSINKGVDKSFAQIGETLTYVITIPNTGNISADNVIFKDTIPNGTTFIANSVLINGAQQSGLVVAPPTGLSIGSIGPNSTTTISFQVTVNTIPTPNPIPNSGSISYIYFFDTISGTTLSGANNTNIVNTTINDAIITSTKTATPVNAIVGGTANYTVVLSNKGNATANNLIFIDTIPTDTTFVANSLKLNGTTQTGASPAPPGFNVGSLAPNGVATITFQVTIDTIPAQNPFPNSSATNYNFVLNTVTGETASNTSNSNIATVFVNPSSNPLKVVDKQFATVGDTLTYTIIWRNDLVVTETNVVLIDTIPNNTTFVSNSINVNGTIISGATINPPNGLNIGTLPASGVTTVTFKVTVDTIPTPNPIPNQAIARYSFISDPTLGTITTETASSNFVNTQVNIASIPSAVKSVSKSFANVGDILTYTISFTNIGNTTATNITLIDTIPNGTTFNINSVFVNGTNQQGAVVAPPTGLSVGSLAVNATATVSFTVTVNTVPSPNPIPNTANVGYSYTIDPVASTNGSGGTNTNTVNTTVSNANLGIIGKTVSKTSASVGDVLTYVITLQNTGNTTANGVLLSDTIPNGTSFVASSVIINGVANTTTVPVGNILALSMGNIAPGGVSSLSFRVNVSSIPNPNPIPNSGTASYTYTVDPSAPNGQNGSNNTNIVNTNVSSANLGGITKFVDKTFAICGEIITYTISIPNTGNVTATNVIMSDTVPSGTVFVTNSILVNGVTSSATTPTSIPLGSISPGATTTVSFSVKVLC